MMAYLFLICFIGLVPAALPLLRPVGHRYFVIMSKVTWPVAQNYCRETYEDLATIESQLDWLRLNTEIARKGLTGVAWTGLYNDIKSWRWTFNDVYLENAYQHWYPGQPDNLIGAEWCGLSGPAGYWWDLPCTNLYPFICYNAKNSYANRFVGVTTPMNWNAAKDYCRTFHTDLAIVTSATDNSAMQAIAGQQGFSWLGLHRDTWKWSDGTNASNILWISGQPNNYYKQENCADLNTGMFEDLLCDTLNYFICHITHPVWERQFLRLQVKFDVIDSDVQSAMLELIKQKIEINGMLKNSTVAWRMKTDGQIFHKRTDLNGTCV